MSDKITIIFTIHEISDLLDCIDQCFSKEDISFDDPLKQAKNKLDHAYFEWRKWNRNRMSE